MKTILDEIERELDQLRNKKKSVFDFGPFRTRRYKKMKRMEEYLLSAQDNLKKYMKKSNFLH